MTGSAPYPAYARVQSPAHGTAVFMLPRKCASNSVKHALWKHMNGAPNVDPVLDYVGKSVILEGGTVTVALVRHPLVRLVSCWREKIMTRWMPSLEEACMRPGMSFAEFLGVVIATPDVIANRHFRSYSDEVIVAGTKPYITLRVEALDTQWPGVEEFLGWEPKGIEHRNISDHHELVLTRSQIAAIEFRYQKDFKNFGYSIEELPPDVGISYDIDSD